MLLVAMWTVGVGAACGLLLLHWFALAFVTIAMSAAFLAAAPWDWFLIPTWFALLTAFQFAYLVAAAGRAWWDDTVARRQDLSGDDAAVSLHGERVLIVEDEPIVAAGLVDEVQAAEGDPVGPAGSVAEALEIIEQEKIDAAVLDVKLFDGEVTPVALTLMARRVPFVILSGVQTPAQITALKPSVPVFRKPVLLSTAVRGLAAEISRSKRAVA